MHTNHDSAMQMGFVILASVPSVLDAVEGQQNRRNAQETVESWRISFRVA
jgi:hypothetical protein